MSDRCHFAESLGRPSSLVTHHLIADQNLLSVVWIVKRNLVTLNPQTLTREIPKAKIERRIPGKSQSRCGSTTLDDRNTSRLGSLLRRKRYGT